MRCFEGYGPINSAHRNGILMQSQGAPGAGYHLCLKYPQEHLDNEAPEVPLLDLGTGELEARYAVLF